MKQSVSLHTVALLLLLFGCPAAVFLPSGCRPTEASKRGVMSASASRTKSRRIASFGQTHSATRRVRRNWLIHQHYVRHEFLEAEALIDKVLAETKGTSEYAIYVKALIRRQQGKIQESLQLFQEATRLNVQNPANLKQVGRSLYLLGKHKQALEVYEECHRLTEDADEEDWELWHHKGLCFLYMKRYPQAIECFRAANDIQRHDATFVQLGKVHTLCEEYEEAIEVYQEALEFSPENADLLTTLGLLYLRLDENGKAFEHLGNSLTFNPRNPKSILAAGSIIQDHNDMDVALIKYRVAAVATPNSPQLWNNVGMCFFGKKQYVAAIACLKRALYLDPFEWIISYNLGLVHLYTEQYASAFHYMSASINIKADFANSYHHLAVALVHLGDHNNAWSAYEKAIELEADHTFRLNYAVSLLRHGEKERAREQFQAFLALWNDLDDEARADEDVAALKNAVEEKLR